MKRSAAALLVALPALAVGQGVSRSKPEREELLMSRTSAVAVAQGTYNSILLPPSSPFLVNVVAARVQTVAAGTGAVTFEVHDGAGRICTCAADCATALAALVPVRIACTGSCLFPGGTQVLLRVPTGGAACSVTQPTFTTLDVRGYWQ